MAQINLLKQNTSRNWSAIILSLSIKLLVLVLLALGAYYGWLFYQNRGFQGKLAAVGSEIERAKLDMVSNSEKQEVFVRQDQLKQLGSLIKSHVYWSNFFPELASSTLKIASYKNIRATTDGELTLTVEVPSMEELEKYLQVFDLAQYNKYFSNVRISSFSQSQGRDSLVIKADIKMDFNPQLLQYNYKQATTTP